MKKPNASYVISFILILISANCYLLVKAFPLALVFLIPGFIVANILPGFADRRVEGFRLKACAHGVNILRIFSWSVGLSLISHLVMLVIPLGFWNLLFSVIVCVCVLAVVFWNGIISVYCTSVQLGIKLRVIGIICGWIPVVNLFVLNKIIRIAGNEVELETEKNRLNATRKDLQVCKTKYPILMVHGVFFRDTEYFNYWGRIPAELERNGADVLYGDHESARPIADSAKEITARIKQIIEVEGCEKVNIIAHSKGGLDCRYAIAHCGAAPYVASLTTVNTPHRGCLFAETLLEKAPQTLKDKVADTYNAALKKLGDRRPDFIAAVTDLTAERCKAFETLPPVPEGIYCRSVGSVLRGSSSGQFPLNLSYHLVKHFDGPNDGLVAESSFAWGEKFTLVTPTGKRGVSHGDMIDLSRENIPGFDVREFYVELVKELKEKGL